MGLIVKPAAFTASLITSAALNSLQNTIYDWAGTSVNGQGSISDANIAVAAAIGKAKIADTAVVCGNTFSPGTQTISRPTVFSGEVLAGSIGSGAVSIPFISGTIYSDGTTTTSSAAGADLKTVTLSANALTTTGRGLKIRAWGKTADGNAHTVSLRWGGQTLCTKILPVTTGNVWSFDATIIRTGLSTQSCYCIAFNALGTTVSGTDGATTALEVVTLAGTQTETAGIIIKCVSDTVTTTGMTQNGLTVEAL